MSIDIYQTTAPAQFQQTAPAWLIEANQVLTLSSTELVSLVQKELEENPALELDERPVCPTCGRAMQGAGCLHCLSLASSSLPQTERISSLDEADSWLAEAERGWREDDEFDPTLLLASKTSLREHLRLTLHEQLQEADTLVIDYLVGNLDEDGYLRCSVQEAAQVCEVAPERVEHVLEMLQAQEPVGIGARDVRECLLIQIRSWEEQGVHQPYAYEIIDRYLAHLAEHKYSQIALELKISLRQVKEAHTFLKETLNPFPTSGYLGTEVSEANKLARPIQPDVIISCKPEATNRTYEVEVVEAQRLSLQISPSYSDAARSISTHRGTADAGQQHVQDYLKRTKLFIANVKRRWQTLSQITSCLGEMQQDFLENGLSALRPLTREQVAEELGLHPSTVSRATAGKFVMLPNRQVVPFSTFFTANLSLKEALKDLIRQENKPLSDQKLAELLKAQGWEVARRTVAKYREELKILPSSER
jgi:RNA polymerase sigma-54 factor